MDDQTDTEREETGGHISFDERIDPGKRCGHTGFRLVITDPAETAPIIEPGRAFAVEGRIEPDSEVTDGDNNRSESGNTPETAGASAKSNEVRLPPDTILVVELVSLELGTHSGNSGESCSEISQSESCFACHDDGGAVVRHTIQTRKNNRVPAARPSGHIVVRRTIQTRKNNRDVWAYYPSLTCYEEALDPGRMKMKDYGFPPLMVADISHPEQSLRNATIKSYFTDTFFKTIIVSATDVAHGAILDDGIGYTDENGEPYSALPEGRYRIVVKLLAGKQIGTDTDLHADLRDSSYADDGNRTHERIDDNCESALSGASYDISIASCAPIATAPQTSGRSIIAEVHKDITIACRRDMAIFRVNPEAHRRNMLAWCDRLGVKMQTNLMPGYLNPYLGTWYYHMGLLPMYRANDVAMYSHARVHMFVYLIDPTSTSYETELCYLQTKQVVGDPSLFKAYHYDIGEAEIKTCNCQMTTCKSDRNTINSKATSSKAINSNADDNGNDDGKNNGADDRMNNGADDSWDNGACDSRNNGTDDRMNNGADDIRNNGADDIRNNGADVKGNNQGAVMKHVEGKEICFDEGRYLDLCRIDVVNSSAWENAYFLDGSGVDDVAFMSRNTDSSLNEIEDDSDTCESCITGGANINEDTYKSTYVVAGTEIAFMGVVRPWQMDPADFILRRDNTYEIHNSVRSIKYEFEDVTDPQCYGQCDNSLTGGIEPGNVEPDGIEPDNIEQDGIEPGGIEPDAVESGNIEQDGKSSLRREFTRELMMERFTGTGCLIGKSVFEFYNIFHVDESYAGRDILVTLTACDKSGENKLATDRILLHVMI